MANKKGFKPGSIVICMTVTEATAEYGFKKGKPYIVSSNMAIPGQGNIIGLVPYDEEDITQVIFVDAKNFESGSVLYLKVWPEESKYELIDEPDAMEKPAPDADYVISRMTLPKSMEKHFDELVRVLVTEVKESVKRASNEDTPSN